MAVNASKHGTRGERDAMLWAKKMPSILLRLFCCFAVFLAGSLQAAEPLLGIWKLQSQTVDGRKVESDDLTLRIYPVGDALEFAYSTPVNGIHLVSMKFVGVRLNGSTANVQDGHSTNIGTVTVSRTGTREYKAVIEGPNRPKAFGTMTVAADDKTLTSKSGPAEGLAAVRAVQVFTRQ